MKKMRFLLCPELVAGDHAMPVDTKQDVLDAVEAWCDLLGGMGAGESIHVKAVMMTDEEIAALPEV